MGSAEKTQMERSNALLKEGGRAMRRAITTVVAMALVVAALATTASAAAGRRTTDCVSGSVNINENVGVSAAIVAPFCAEIKAGDWWVPAAFWVQAKNWDLKPDGYIPVGETPLEEFVANFVGVRYVVDQGTKHEFTVEFANGPSLWTDAHPIFPDDLDLASPMTLGSIRPLSVGPHTVTMFWTLSADTCDGLDTDPELACAPAGEFEGFTDYFDVVAN